MRGNLPERTLVWRLVQDHVQPSLLFLATEFGLYFSHDGGGQWTPLKGGVPTISFRDLTIQRRENDLVAASFGRGFYVLDDLSALREVSDATLAAEATLFSTRRASWYFPRPHLGFDGGLGDQGAGHYVAPNPPFGAVFTYYLQADLLSQQKLRAEREKAAEANASFPGWAAVEAERRELSPQVWLTVRDAGGQVVRRVEGKTTKGFHRVAWDLRYPPPNAIELEEPPPPLWGGPPRGLMAAPGTYTVTLSKQVNGEVTPLSEPRPFEVTPLRAGALPAAHPTEVAAFWRSYEAAVRSHTAMVVALREMLARAERMRVVLARSTADVGSLDATLHALRADLLDLDHRLNGDRAKQSAGEKHPPIPGDRLAAVSRGVDRSTHGPTATHRQMLAIAASELAELRDPIQGCRARLTALASSLVRAGAPWIEGEPLPIPKR